MIPPVTASSSPIKLPPTTKTRFMEMPPLWHQKSLNKTTANTMPTSCIKGVVSGLRPILTAPWGLSCSGILFPAGDFLRFTWHPIIRMPKGSQEAEACKLISAKSCRAYKKEERSAQNRQFRFFGRSKPPTGYWDLQHTGKGAPLPNRQVRERDPEAGGRLPQFDCENVSWNFSSKAWISPGR